jgi:probable rRNA maturation factor
MKLALKVQVALDSPGLPREAELQRWVKSTLTEGGCRRSAELVIRIVDEAESTALNETYRHRQGSTNVLSFPFEAPPGLETNLLGDVIICAPVVLREAQIQCKSSAAHWAHMVVHGVLHLLGYDHDDESEAEDMEALEIRILKGLGYPDPYREVDNC